MFDSWAGHLSPLDYDVFAAPYQRRVIEKIKAAHPEVPIIIYINKVRMHLRTFRSCACATHVCVYVPNTALPPTTPCLRQPIIPPPHSTIKKQSGALLERMAASGADIVSLDWTVTMEEGRRRIGEQMGVQGNLDPAILYGPQEVIKVHALLLTRWCLGRGEGGRPGVSARVSIYGSRNPRSSNPRPPLPPFF